MSLFAALQVALSALLTNKGRSVLTSLGIVIGISAVIAMVSAGDGARDKLDERLGTVGKNLILIQPGGRNEQGIVTDTVPLTGEDAAAIRRNAGYLLDGVAESQMTGRLASTRTGIHPTFLVGSVPDLYKIRAWKLEYGRFLSDDDVKKLAPVCLIGQTVRRKLFPDKRDPTGEMIRVDRLQLRVIGVLAAKGRSPTGADQDDQIFLPITTLQRKLMGEEKIAIIVAVGEIGGEPRPGQGARSSRCCANGIISSRASPTISTSTPSPRWPRSPSSSPPRCRSWWRSSPRSRWWSAASAS